MRIAVLLIAAAASPAAAAPTATERARVAYAPPNAPPPPGLRIERQPDPARYYPARERKAKVEGSSDLGLILRYDGVVTGCTIEGSSGSARLDEAACKLARALRFQRLSLADRFPKVEYGCCLRLRVDWSGGTASIRRTGPGRSARITNRAELVTAADYPPEALRAGAAGAVGIRLTVSASGAVTGCEVTSSSGSALLDEAACRLARERARTEPATDPYGEPAEGSVSMRLRWEMSP